jgi:solute carrier family 25 (mitochondrial S-adenosylmethionine transporter), member 26
MRSSAILTTLVVCSHLYLYVNALSLLGNPTKTSIRCQASSKMVLQMRSNGGFDPFHFNIANDNGVNSGNNEQDVNKVYVSRGMPIIHDEISHFSSPINSQDNNNDLKSSNVYENNLKSISTGAISLLFFLFSFVGSTPDIAHASYGSGGAAVSSQPIIRSVTPEEYMKLSDKKQRQRDFGTVCGSGVGFAGKNRVCERDVDVLYKEFKELDNEMSIQKLQKKIIDRTDSEVVKMQKEAVMAANIERQLAANAEFLDRLSKQPAWISYVAAALGSCVSTLIMHPIDTLKTRIMSSEGGEQDGEEGGMSILDALKDVKSLYGGVWANVVKEAPASALYLGIYEYCRTILMTTVLSEYPLAVYLLAGAAGEFVGSVVRMPAESIKVQVQLGADIPSAISKTLEPKGISELYKAWSCSLWRDVPMGAIQLALFEAIKSYVINSPNLDFDVNTLTAEAIFGSIGGAVGAFISAPADNLTINILAGLKDETASLIIEGEEQTEDGTDASGASMPRNTGALAVAGASGGSTGYSLSDPFPPSNEAELGALGMAKKVYTEQGVGGFFKGVQERTIYWAFAISIFLSVYCSIRRAALGVF